MLKDDVPGRHGVSQAQHDTFRVVGDSEVIQFVVHGTSDERLSSPALPDLIVKGK
jgi:hypothetical protein